MLLQEVNPFLRCAVRFRYARVHSVRCPADARILYVTEGGGTLWLDGTEHPLCAGTLALIGPGVVYRMELDSPLELIALNFDYTWQRQHLEETLEALPPEEAERVEKVTVEDCPALSAPMILQNAQTLTNAIKLTEADLKHQLIYYNNNEMDKWCLKNAGIKVDDKGYCLLIKQETGRRIDGAVCLAILYEMYRRYRTDYRTLIGGA